ncbi:peptide/nickel transport system ATP-binding protein [Devosia sp. YR412]|uniref:ATP-binding cassette domain-containing protein n=1 Tax=Devosia sp. YR412 TaxID=1881030 RepID=UPI0008C73630|nr:ATP-binding cassette domain-containing protein [Devosia sp. YR412]SEQ62606.1 peptide/nickel transport system ATP-binding protein [Devosia sp. YR412]
MLLSVEDFSVSFRRYAGLLQQRLVPALQGLSFSLDRGEVLALVGASGAGKSLLAHALFDILPPNAVTTGQLVIDGSTLDQSNWPDYRGRRMGLVPQSASHLDPLARCGKQLAWAARRSGSTADPQQALARFGLDATAAKAFPHQLSGGMARRMMLAMATIGKPDLIVADEPTSGLDPDNAAVVLGHLHQLADAQKGVLLITHDLAQALPFATRVAILRDGRLVDIEPASAFTGAGAALKSDYARRLWQSMPQNGFLTHA